MFFEDGSTQPPTRADVPTLGNLSGDTVGVGDVMSSSDPVRPQELSSGSFSSFHACLAPLRFLDVSLVGPRAELESTMHLDELAERCTTPAIIETTLFTHLP